MKFLTNLATALTLSSTLLFASGEGWVTDFAAAKEQAAKENKDLLVDFTGSDWCSWCIKLDEEVFQEEAFQKYVADKFVLVELDYPRQTEQAAELKEQNERLATDYQIQGYPTILLMDADGRPYARTGYQEGGPEAFNAQLGELQKIKTQFIEGITAADKLEGVEKAKGYLTSLQLIPTEYSSFYQPEIDTVLANDPEDETGLKAEMEMDDALAVLSDEVDALIGEEKVDEAAAKVDAFIEENELPADLEKSLKLNRLYMVVNAKVGQGEIDAANAEVDAYLAAHTDIDAIGKQEILGMKIDAYMTAQQFDNAATVVDEIIALDPESSIGKMAANFKSQIAQYREQAEAAKAAAEEPKAGE